ncbi:hypothetical protein ACFVHR_04710 [Streptomyces sp. NPDC127168]|uniref:hypothetical protein n=1 Tax=unclassified Streptomyces TaxID=2593676 RepID=UPI0036354FFF
MTARITIVERTDKDLTDRLCGWHWFWMATLPGRGTRSGFARTQEKARQHAERAAREMTDLPEENVERYEYDPRPA